MKANEFVKKAGMTKVNDIIINFESNETSDCCFDSGEALGEDKSWWDICVYDLKRIVESHELVEKWRGLEASKIKVSLLRTFGFDTQADQLQEAIADVESCQ